MPRFLSGVQWAATGIIATLFIALQVADLLDYYAVRHLDRNGALTSRLSELLTTNTSSILRLAGYAGAWLSANVFVVVGLSAIYYHSTSGIYPRIRNSPSYLILFQALSLLGLVLWNRVVFPYSVAFRNSDILLLQDGSSLLLGGLGILVAGTSAVAIVRIALIRKRLLAAACLLGATGFVVPPIVNDSDKRSTTASARSPDVILIGVDSLRPDFLAPQHPSSLAPNINEFLTQSVRLGDATTPQARTFVAYMSLLSGQYPTRHGVRFNLHPRSQFDRSRDLLPYRFKAAGYATAFAMDETRFANIDSSFGFDIVATPPPSALDFVVGSFFDSIGTNLLLLAPGIAQAFPLIYGNRGANRTYRPDDHTTRVLSLIERLPKEKPAFFISHFCLPHWPYDRGHLTNDDEQFLRANDPFKGDTPTAYLRAIQSVDHQVGLMLDALDAAGRLDNAIVVLFSDHGEGLGLPADLLKANDLRAITYNSYAHGGFALADSQFRVVLSMQRWIDGERVWKNRTIRGPASLIDIFPTVIAAARLKHSTENLDGNDLLPVIQSGAGGLPSRLRFVESGLTGRSVEGPAVDEREAAQEFGALYVLTDDSRFEVDPARLKDRLALKQRGVIYGETGLMTKPRVGSGQYDQDCWLQANYVQRTLRCVPRPAEDPETSVMFEAVCSHFAGDEGFQERWCDKKWGVGDPRQLNLLAARHTPVKESLSTFDSIASRSLHVSSAPPETEQSRASK